MKPIKKAMFIPFAIKTNKIGKNKNLDTDRKFGIVIYLLSDMGSPLSILC